jgi:hypothetical protein
VIASRAPFFDKLMEMDGRLAAAGFHPMSKWWRELMREFYVEGKRRLVVCVGRRGGKSDQHCRIAVAEVLYGEHVVPKGDTGIYALASVSTKEVKGRIRTIKAILDALGEEWYSSYDDIFIKSRPDRMIRIYAAKIDTIVGGTWIGFGGDEVSKWRDDKLGSNPATEILRSARPAMKSMVLARELLFSSPWAMLDAHHKHMAEGDTARQMVRRAPTWVANEEPWATEAECRAEEPDELVFRREYGAIPMPSDADSLIDGRAIDASLVDGFPGVVDGENLVAGMDLGFRRDAAALVICAVRDGVYHVAHAECVRPINGPLVPSAVLTKFRESLQRFKMDKVAADHYYRDTALEHLAGWGIGLLDPPKDQTEQYIRLRVVMNAGKVTIPKKDPVCDGMVDELRQVVATPTHGGRVTIHMSRTKGSHSDLVAALALCVHQRTGISVFERKEKTIIGRPDTADDLLQRTLDQYADEPKDEDSWYTDRTWIT